MVIKYTLPDDLAVAARKAGLLAPEKYAFWLESELLESKRKQELGEFFNALGKIHAVPDPNPMSPEEVSVELHQMRAEEGSRDHTS